MKTLFFSIVATLAGVGFFLFLGQNIKHEIAPVLDCEGHTPTSFACYAKYYRALTTSSGVQASVLDLKHRTRSDVYTKKECHLLMHEIGRAKASAVTLVGEAFALGDPFCATGYYHGVMEGLVHKRGTTELSREFLDSLCVKFRESRDGLDPKYQDCAHGLGHGIMSVKNNELFEALDVCDLLSDGRERELCWTGVFMENTITDLRDHTTKYLKPDDPAYPCDVVEEKYKKACYSYQSAHMLKIFKSFEKVFEACRKIPDRYQDVCFQSIGRDATAELVQEDIAHTKENCLIGVNAYEEENCVIGAVRYIMANQENTDGQAFCAILPGYLQSRCYGAAASYSKILAQ